MLVNNRQPQLPPDTMAQARVVLLVLAAVTATFDVWLFIWAWQLRSPVLVLFGLVCLPMGLVLAYGAALACQSSDTPGAQQILRERRQRRRGWTSHTPQYLARFEPSHPQRAQVRE